MDDKDNCFFLYERGKKQIPIPLDKLKDIIFCIPDRRGRSLYYIKNELTGELKFISYQKLINICTEKKPDVRQHLISTCLNRDVINDFTDDTGHIKNFLYHFQQTGGIDECILDFLEQILLYTHVNYQSFLEIMGGAYVVLKGDRGHIANKFRKCSQHKLEINIPVGVTWESLFSPGIKYKDVVPMSSHGKYMRDAYRIGAGYLTLCDKEGLYETDNPLKNPRFDILMGTSIDQRYMGDTAFQFESCRMDDLKNFVRHGLVWFEYKRVKKNVGAFGYSVYTDKDPLVISTCGNNICPRFLRVKK